MHSKPEEEEADLRMHFEFVFRIDGPTPTSSSPRLVYQLATHSIRFLFSGMGVGGISPSQKREPRPYLLTPPPSPALICLWLRDFYSINIFP